MRGLTIGVVLGLVLSAVLARGADTTTMLSAFLANLNASHLIMPSGGTAPSLSNCGTGSLATGSSDTSGRVTATGATSCTVTFGASFGANSADCIVEDLNANRGNVSAASATAFTVSNLTSSDVFMYICAGR